MNKKGISYRLNWAITSIAILIIAITGYINYRFNDYLLIAKIEEGAIYQSNLVVSKISRITIGTEEITRNISYQTLYFYKRNDLSLYLKQVLASNKTLESVQVELVDSLKEDVTKFSANRLSEAICKPEPLIDETYIRNIQSGKIVPEGGGWSDIYYCQNDTSNLFVSYQYPFYTPGSNNIAGIVSSEVSLRKIKQLLTEIKIGDKGYAFIIDRAGRFITHPDERWILKRNFFDETSPLQRQSIKDIEFKIKKGGRGVGHGISEYLGHKKCWFFYAPLSNPEWTLIIVIPQKELFIEHDIYLYKILAVSIIGVIILFLLNMIIFKKVLDPLARVTYAIHGFTSVPGKDRKIRNEI